MKINEILNNSFILSTFVKIKCMKNLFILVTALTLFSCGNNQKEDNLENLNKKSAREVVLTTQTKGDTVYHITKQLIWYNNEQIASSVDTIVTLKKENTWETAQDSTLLLDQIPIYVTIQ